MHTSLDRREFLKASSTMAVAAGLHPGGRLVSGSSASPNKNAARLFPGCCAYSYAKHLEKGAMTMEDFILKGVELGVEAVDMTAYWLRSTEAPYLLRLRQLAFQNCMMFSGVAIKTEMCQSSKAARVDQVQNIKRWTDSTALLGASHLRVFAGALPEGASVQQGIEWTAETMKAACEYSAKSGVALGLEDHHGVTARADAVLDIIRRVDSPYAGVTLDIDNFDVNSEEERYSDIEACVPFATHVHIRDVGTKTRQPLDLDRVWRLFAKAGYKGFVSAEYEGEEDPVTAVPKLVSKIQTLCRKYSSA